ncbi:NAD(P)-binding domain-containing protein [Agarilytica rhodophyticola]|uniref:NAD(P)-binding domain-containing protein n=1 Tax=Agarilytica rhodophyticola TaxID=1737490 RepID=UPI000B3430E7|nr:NAD(P)-binding domain-containing protein [Agarilytica rhodophyticola]
MTTHSKHKYLIIGAGPGGLQLGYYLQKSGRDYLILESGECAGKRFQQYPRHGQLISINKVYTGYDDPEVNLRWDWNSLLCDGESDVLFKHYSQEYFPKNEALLEYLDKFSEHYQLNVKYKTSIVNISREGDIFHVKDNSDHTYIAEQLIVATGFSEPYMPPIEGIELAETYGQMSLDLKEYTNKRVLVIGKGNSAFETADHLLGATSFIHVCSPNPISMAWTTKYVGHLRAVNNNFLDSYQLKSQNAVLDATIKGISKEEDGSYSVSLDYSHADGEKEVIVYDKVILCAGFRFDDSLFDDTCKPTLSRQDRFPEQTSEWESTNIKGLYFAGVLMHQRDYKKKQSGFIHGFRYNIHAMHKILENKYEGQALPCIQLMLGVSSICEQILYRINVSSALWQQTGFLADAIIIRQSDSTADYYSQLPMDYIHEGNIFENYKDTKEIQNQEYLTVSLEFGAAQADPFNIQRKPHPDKADDSAFLHPVIKHYKGGELAAELHLLEDLAGEWKKDVHIDPLKTFIETQLASHLPKQQVEDKVQ